MILKKSLKSPCIRNLCDMYRRVDTISNMRVFITPQSKQLTIKRHFHRQRFMFLSANSIVFDITYKEGYRSLFSLALNM